MKIAIGYIIGMIITFLVIYLGERRTMRKKDEMEGGE